MIGFLKQAHVSDMNLKTRKDHLPADAVEEIKALGIMFPRGIKLHAAGTILFFRRRGCGYSAKFEYRSVPGLA